ncbi:hypothetical protein P171DRAFT_491872 [Karstenula rhodostoma CBS 690.94]|uniref:Lysine-specific metallo-endopeptidase domain-containing protein n=1 Tax=Karstenula rhodostoma CBS 690.94 TaxID=1392251 RepID=A0A9P4P3A2_9PLEO|nr:hypothetical protein P171DRAFT_491872 [Karstenula rhodostoma CBS 690.94]
MVRFFKVGLIALFVAPLYAAYTYTVEVDCSLNSPQRGDGVHEAILEIIHHSKRFATALSQRDDRFNDILKWFFGVDVGNNDISHVFDVFQRIGDMLPEITEPTLNSLVRVHCDDQQRYKAKSDQFEDIPYPQDDATKTKTWVADIVNNCISLASDLGCRESSEVYAELLGSYREPHTRWLEVASRESSLNPDRTTLDICKRTFDSGLPFTFRQIAKKELDNPDFRAADIDSLIGLVILHELTHVPKLSEQTFRVGGQPKAETGGSEDYHGPEQLVGYYTHNTYDKTLAEHLENKIEYTMMNADSYAYALGLFILYGKQWVPSRDTDGTIKFTKDTNVPLEGDWPGAEPLETAKRSIVHSPASWPKAHL